MHKKMRNRIISIGLAAAMLGGLVGCGNSTTTQTEGTDAPETEVTTVAADGESTTEQKSEVSDAKETGRGVQPVDLGNLIWTLTNSFESAGGDTQGTFLTPQYLLPKDYVFEFDASLEASYIAYDAFDVYMSPNLDQSQATFCECKYEDGKIRVYPRGAIEVTATGSRNSDKAEWGSLDKLYLVQNIDLQTGEELEDKLITPFSIQHDLDSPTVLQGVTADNLYQLKWDAVPNAASYRVYENIGSGAYMFECETKNLEVNVEEFTSQKDSEELADLFKKDLENAGYTVDESGYVTMNSAVQYSGDEDGRFVVIAVSADGKQSGISNEVDVREVAPRLPYKITENIEKTISSAEEAPIYVNVTMIDGSETQMLINYHGGKAYKFEDKIVIQAHVYNTLFSNFMITLYGYDYDSFKDSISDIHARQDSLNISNGLQEVEVKIPQSPSKEESAADREAEAKLKEELGETPATEVPTTEAPTTEAPTTEAPTTEAPTTEAPTTEAPTTEAPTTEAPTTEAPTTEAPTTEAPTTEAPTTEVPTTEAASANGLDVSVPDGVVPGSNEENYYKAVAEVQERLKDLPGIEDVFFAKSDLEAWIAFALITQMEVIPVPVSIYPESADSDYLGRVLLEAYRQNPTSGILKGMDYNYGLESIVVAYCQDKETRLKETKEELAKAREVAATITGTDTEKAQALNQYFCDRASYDFDSMATDVDMNTLSKSFIDAHNPYGILCNDYGVCESYSESFALVGRLAGLEVLMQSGTLNGGGHEWNRVKLNGNWYVIDVTNNDRDLAKNALLTVSDAQAEGVLVNSDKAYMGSYPANDDSQDYYKLNGRAAATRDEAITMLVDQLKNGGVAEVRLPAGTSETEATDIGRTAITEAGIEQVRYSKLGDVIGLMLQ